MALHHGSLGRSLSRMAIHVNQEANKKTHEGDRFAANETDQQFQLDIAGKARATPIIGTSKLFFDETIYCDIANRDNPNLEPHVYVGKVIDSGPHVFIDAHVTSWSRDPNGNYVGCTVRVGAYDPTDSRRNFSGRLHVTIQGYSAPSDTDEPTGDGQGSGGPLGTAP